MERPTKKLWRKIGLQKNFLEGTSHSDQSRNTLSQFQQSLNKSRCSQCSRSNFPQETENFRIQPHKVQCEGEFLKNLICVKKQKNLEQVYCQTPINQLNISISEGRELIWQQADDTIDLISENKQSVSNFSESVKQSRIQFQSLRINEEKQKVYNNILTQTVPYKFNTEREEKNDRRERQEEVKNINQEKKTRKMSIDSIKIRLHGVEQKESETNESQYAKIIRKSYHNAQEISKQQIYTLQIDPRELEKYQKVQRQINRIKSVSLHKIFETINQVKKKFSLQKSFIIQEMNIMRERMTQIITIQLSEEMQQLNDEIGYLYSENQQLMKKLDEKQSIIKKHHEQYTKLQQQLSQYTQSIRAQNQFKDHEIIQLQNQINKLQQKLEDFEEFQTKIEKEKQKNEQLENQLSILIKNEKQFSELMDQKTFDLSAAIIKNQELQWQVNQLYNKNEQIQSNFKKQIAQRIEKLQNEHINRLNLEKTFLEKQKSKSKIHESLVEALTNILDQSLKHINLNLIKTIRTQFNIEKNEYLNQIFQKAILETKSSSKDFNFNRDQRQISIQSNQLSPRSDSENGNSSNKNLRRTGYFGQVTKPILSIRLDDIQKKFSKQIPQDENLDFFHNNRVQIMQEKTKNLFRGDSFSDISEEGSVKQNYASRTIQSSYPRNYQNEERKWSKQKHLRYDSDHTRSPFLNDSITQDLQRVKFSLNQEKNPQYTKNFSIQTTNQPQYFVKHSNNQNVNYSFSEKHWNAFDLNDDGSSVKTYEKSETNYKEKERYMSKNNYTYQRAPTERSERSEKSGSDRQDIIEKIKERVKQKLRSKEKNHVNVHEPSYSSHAQTFKRPSYHESEHEQIKPIKKEDLILADFYQRHLIKNPVFSQNQTERKMSPLVGRSPSNTRSRSPSNSSTNRVPSQTIKVGATRYNPIGTATYATVNQNKTTISVTPRNTFSKSMVQRPQFSAYSKRTTNQPTATGVYQPKSNLYSINRGETQLGSTYGKK